MSLVILLPVLFVLVIGLVVYAIAKNRPGIVAAVGGGLLLLLIGGGLLAFVGVRTARHTSNASWQFTPGHIEAHFEPVSMSPSNSYQSSMRISIVGVLFVIALPFILLFALLRNTASSRHNGHRAGGGWVVPIIGVIALGFLALLGAKWFALRQYNYRAAQQEAIAHQSEVMQQMVAHQQAQIEQQTAMMDIDAQTDIHALMDKTDAPRIPLPPAAPAPPEPSVATSASGSEANDDNEDTSTKPENSTGNKSSKRKSQTRDDKTTPAPANRPAAAQPSIPQAEADSPEVSVVPSRPSWVDSPPKRVGDTMREVIATDEYATVDECTRATDVYLLLKTYERLMELAGTPVFDSSLPSLTFNDRDVVADGTSILSSDGGRTWNWNDSRIAELSQLGIGVDYVRREIVSKDGDNYKQYFDTVQRSIGPMHKLYTEIEFTRSVDNELRQRWATRERGERLTAVGAGAGGILGLLGLAYGLLKVDTWTKGYYSKRLFLGVPAAIIGLVALFALLVGP